MPMTLPRLTRRLTLAAALFATIATSVVGPREAAAQAPNETLIIELKTGRVVIELLPNFAPGHVERIKLLAGQGFYDGLKFHRVIDGFMAQTGDPKGTGEGGSSLPDLRAEFTRYPYRRGTVGMARTQSPNTANSQFFICFDDQGCLGLTGQYTVWGQVVSGMEFVDKIKRGSGRGGEVEAPADVMVKVTVGPPIRR